MRCALIRGLRMTPLLSPPVMALCDVTHDLTNQGFHMCPSAHHTAIFQPKNHLLHPPPDEVALSGADTHWLRQAFVWANAARLRGNRPFGAMVVAQDGRILAEAFSNTWETGDSTGHAEMNCVRQIGMARVSAELLASATLYASAQPCAMCAGAICAAGLQRVVFGLDAERLYGIAPNLRPNHITCFDIFSQNREAVDCVGPCLVQEALAVYEDSWLSSSSSSEE